MKYIKILLPLVFLSSCGLSQKDKDEIATITCNIIAESKNMDAAFRIQEVNKARETLREERFLGKDTIIKEAFFYGLCKELIINDPNFDQILEQKREEYLERVKEIYDSIAIVKQKELDSLTRVYEEVVKKREERVDQYRQARASSQQEWRNSLMDYLSDYIPSSISGVTYSNRTKSLSLSFQCSKKVQGMKKRFVVKFNNGLKDLISEEGYCFYGGIKFDKDQLSKDHYNAIIEVQDNPKSIIKSITLEITTVVLIEDLGFEDLGQVYEQYFPQNYKYLEASERLDNPIRYDLSY